MEYVRDVQTAAAPKQALLLSAEEPAHECKVRCDALTPSIVRPEGVVHLRLLRHESEFVLHESGFDPTNSGGTQQRPGTSRDTWSKPTASYSTVGF